jgi:hypothetical protein
MEGTTILPKTTSAIGWWLEAGALLGRGSWQPRPFLHLFTQQRRKGVLLIIYLISKQSVRFRVFAPLMQLRASANRRVTYVSTHSAKAFQSLSE